MAVQDNQIKAAINEYFFKNRADFEAHKNEIENNSKFYIEDDGLGVVTMQTKVLWENSSPTSSFSPQDIQINDINNYDYFIITTRMSTSSSVFRTELIKRTDVLQNNGTFRLNAYPNSGILNRNDNYIKSNGIHFDEGVSSNSTNNGVVIPIQIIGIKLIESPTQITNKYSTEETVVGEWIDGKKIYRKVFELDNAIAVSSTFVNIIENTTNIDQIISLSAISGDDIPYCSSLLGRVKNNFIQGYYPNTIGVKILMVEYTKTTD